MKKELCFIFCLGAALMACNTTNNPPEDFENPEAVLLSPPFSRGVNFSAWFETSSAQGIPFTKYVEQDFADVKSMGADVIRLPIKMHSMTGGAPDFTLDPLLLGFLDNAVNWAEKYQLYLIIDNHSFDPIKPLEPSVEGILISVWKQIANRYKNRSGYIVYEILNEPHGIADKAWGEIQGKAVDAIRAIDTNRWIIVGGTDYNSIGKMSELPRYTDDKLIYTFHFYDPYLFTHQGANWGEPSLASLAGVPFPYDAKRMPPCPAPLKGTWIESNLKYDYPKNATLKALNNTLNTVVSFSKARGVPIFCGEFGVYIPNSPAPDRVRWYEAVTDMLVKRNIARTSWDYFGGFGIFNTDNGGDFNCDLNVGVVSAMGFTPPPQSPRPSTPIAAGFTLYDDYPAKEYSSGYWGDDTDFSLYETTNTAEGVYAIRWGNAAQYDVFWFNFDRNGDFSQLANSGYSLEFRARTSSAVTFDVRFVNPESSAERAAASEGSPPVSSSSIPWRMRYGITSSILPPDGKWHTIRIPLHEMTEQGAWINETQTWVTPRGEFSWGNVKQLQFVAEENDLKNHTIWFDSIKIVEQ